MTKSLFSAVLLIAITTNAQLPPGATPSESTSTSVQKMLESGPQQLKMHALAMILQGKIQGGIDESYLPGLKTCAQDNAAAIRSMAAKAMGVCYVQDKDNPNPEALNLLKVLAEDPAADVRFNAIYHGLSQIKNKTPEDAEMLIDIAAKERNPALQDRIIISLANYQPQVEDILNEKLKGDDAIVYYEIYEEFTGKEPPNAEKFLDMPSSRPHLIIVKPVGKDAKSAKSALMGDLKKTGIKSPSVEISGTDDHAVLLVTTYITRNYKIAKDFLKGNDEYSITQDMWLTPELEIQLEAMRKTGN